MHDLQTRSTRYYLGECDQIDIGVKVTETSTGQFDDAPDGPFEMSCAFGSPNHTTHVMRPATVSEYEAWASKADDTC